MLLELSGILGIVNNVLWGPWRGDYDRVLDPSACLLAHRVREIHLTEMRSLGSVTATQRPAALLGTPRLSSIALTGIDHILPTFRAPRSLWLYSKS